MRLFPEMLLNATHTELTECCTSSFCWRRQTPWSTVVPSVFQFAKHPVLLIKLKSCVARASRLAWSLRRRSSRDSSLCLRGAEPHVKQQRNKPTLNRLFLKTIYGRLQPREKRRAVDRLTPPPPSQQYEQQNFAKCPHAMGRSKLQVMDFEGAEMFIRRDEQNGGRGMWGSCCLCHIARREKKDACGWWEAWIYVLKVGVELRLIVWGGDASVGWSGERAWGWSIASSLIFIFLFFFYDSLFLLWLN